MNYKLQDKERIIEYISTRDGVVEVEDLLLHSGAERLRVYPILFELEQEGWLEVTEREGMGCPKKVRPLPPGPSPIERGDGKPMKAMRKRNS